ncbi:MAG: tryptophan 7-halogenase [Parvularculaceae bacterium]|nr:tryptophan 7-halogenase [Parvularculaceae bacterium]
MTERIKSVVIVGGGTAGWMTAAALSRYLPSDSTKITLIESEDIGTVGVGEATIPQIATFNRMLSIDEREFVRATKATFKLGIEFRDWGEKGDHYFHPFGTYGWDLEGTEFHHFWRRAQMAGDDTPIDAYCLNAAVASAGRFALPDGNPRSPLSKLAYAYHFDALLYAKFLRRYAEARGVERWEGCVQSVKQDSKTGFVGQLGLDDGREISGELFIDCTGFVGLLIEKTLGAGYDDWTDMLPMDRAVAVPCARVEPPKPYTIATADEAGWRWRIPLQHRTGNGHVYSSSYTDDEKALQSLLENLDGEPLADPRQLRFTTGIRRKFWDKNVVAIGLSGGFLEPLESTSIHMIQTAIAKLLALYPDRDWSEVDRDEYNRLLKVTFTHIRDFIVLHYVATDRKDTAFWRDRQHVPVSETLQRKMDLLQGAGRFFRYEDELFSVTSWLAVMQGQGRAPQRYNPMADSLSDMNLSRSLADMRKVIDQTTASLPTHDDFLQRFMASAPAGAHA